MKIIYIISSFNKGVGGHLRSLVTTAKEISNYHDIEIITIGFVESPVIQNSGLPASFVKLRKNIFSLRKEIQMRLKKETNNLIIHAYDDISYYCIHNSKVPKVVTKCGGPNVWYYLKPRYLILFSKENQKFFTNKKRFCSTHKTVISNRVKNFSCDHEKINQLKISLNINTNEIILLRICRISNYYIKSMYQSVNILESLIKDGVKARLIICGNIYEEEAYSSITKYAENKNINIVTDDYYTVDAKLLIDLCHVYIGTGRGIMEASSKGKILLTPQEDSMTPLVVNQLSFNDFYSSNFSERNHTSKINSEQSKEEIIKLLTNKISLERYQQFSIEIFNSYFNIETGVTKLNKLYLKIANDNSIYKLSLLDRLRYFLLYSITYRKKKKQHE